MPIYEYECFLCGERFERIQRVSDPPITTCPHCSGSVRRLLGVPALQFKGSGWYVTDYGRGSAQSTAGDGRGESKAESSESSSKPASSTSSSSKSDD
jgi:putative FmdB family regulatory protein